MTPDAAAATCRRAATGIRTLCANTTGTDWHMEIWPDGTYPEIAAAVVCAGTDTAVAQCGDNTNPQRRANAAYITRMRPQLGLRLADLFELAGDWFGDAPPGAADTPQVMSSILGAAEDFLRQAPTGRPAARPALTASR